MTENAATTNQTPIDFKQISKIRAKLAVESPSIAPPKSKDIYFDLLSANECFSWAVFGGECTQEQQTLFTTAMKKVFDEGYRFSRAEATENLTDITDFVAGVEKDLSAIRAQKVDDPSEALTAVFNKFVDLIKHIIMSAIGVPAFRGAKADAFIQTNIGLMDLTLSNIFVAWLNGAGMNEMLEAFDTDFCEREWCQNDGFSSYPEELD